MKLRTNLFTASRVDLTLILLPAITWLEASCILALSGVPAELAARVLALPDARRAPTKSPPAHSPAEQVDIAVWRGEVEVHQGTSSFSGCGA